MKKNIIFSMCASLLFLASCDYNEDNFPGYDELAIPKDVQNVELSLADGDYKKVAGLESNIKLATDRVDPEGIDFVTLRMRPCQNSKVSQWLFRCHLKQDDTLKRKRSWI